MNEEGQKEIDWKKIARTFAFSLVWYISIFCYLVDYWCGN